MVQLGQKGPYAYVIKPVDLAKFREAISLIEQFFFLLACVPSQNIDA